MSMSNAEGKVTSVVSQFSIFMTQGILKYEEVIHMSLKNQ